MKRTGVEGKQKEVAASLATETDPAHYLLRLFVTGATPRSSRAIQNIRAICEDHLQGRYDLEGVDIYQHPEHAKAEQIVVTPTLVKRTPLPVCKLIVIANQAANARIAPAMYARMMVSRVDMKTLDSPASTILVTNSEGTR